MLSMKTDGIRGFRNSWFHAYLQWDCRMFVYHVYESLIDQRLYETALNICHLRRHRIRGIRYSWFHADAIYLQWDSRLFAYHVYESLTDPRLYKVDHCCLSLSRALTSCSCFKLCCFVTERQVLCSSSWHVSLLCQVNSHPADIQSGHASL